MPAPQFTITQGTTAPSLELVLSDASGGPDLTTATGVVFDMRDAASGIRKVADADAVISDPAGRKVRYDWTEGDTDTVGTFHGKFTVTWDDGTTTAWPTDKTATNNYVIVNVVDDAKAVD